MGDIKALQNQIQQMRNELRNIRKEVATLKHVQKKELDDLKKRFRPCVVNQIHCDHSSTGDKEDVTDVRTGPKSDNRAGSEPLQQSTAGVDLSSWKPIGHVHSIFTEKNGTPRQANICTTSTAVIKLRQDLFTNPGHALDGLHEFSYLWVLYVFHKNNNHYTKAKVAPPRLNGARVGLFSTRCPYRPNPIGLSLVKLDSVQGSSIHVLGVDILDGSPVLDIKPYITQYDYPMHQPQAALPGMSPDAVDPDNIEDRALTVTQHDMDTSDKLRADKITEHTDNGAQFDQPANQVPKEADQNTVKDDRLSENKDGHLTEVSENKVECISDSKDGCLSDNKDERHSDSKDSSDTVRCSAWISAPPIPTMTVLFTERAESDIKDLCTVTSSQREPMDISGDTRSKSEATCLDLRASIVSILQADPRSTYRRRQCSDRLYYLTLANTHVTCWFDDNVVEVLRVKTVSEEST